MGITDSDEETEALPMSLPSASPAAYGFASHHPHLGNPERPAFELPHIQQDRRRHLQILQAGLFVMLPQGTGVHPCFFVPYHLPRDGGAYLAQVRLLPSVAITVPSPL